MKNYFRKIMPAIITIIILFTISNTSIVQANDTQELKTTQDGFRYYINETDNTVIIDMYIGENNNVTIPSSIDNKVVTAIGNDAFRGCSSLTDITIPNNVTTIGISAFRGCSNLINLTIPNSVTNIGVRAFKDCNNLTHITLPSNFTCDEFIEDIKESVESLFSGCNNLTDITVSSNNGKFSSEDGVLFNKEKTKIFCYPSGKKGSFTIPNSVTRIEYCAFMNCIYLDSIIIPSSVTNIEQHAFYNCSRLNSITLFAKVDAINEAVFNGCSNLTNITIPDSVVSIGDYAFGGCSSLTNITVPNSVTSIGYRAFGSCTSLTHITIPNTITHIGGYAFSNCSSLTNITIPDNITSIKERTFSDCSSLTDINIPNKVTYIENSAFSGCNSLTCITIPNSVTTIGDFAFADCTHLSSIIIPENITSLGYDLFNGSGKNENTIDIYFIGSQSVWGKISNPYIDNDNVNIHFNSTFPETVTLNDTELKLSVGTSKTLSTSITPTDVTAQKIIWYSNDPDVISCSTDGTISALIPGTATITAMTVNGLTDIINVTVTDQCGEQGHTEEIIPALGHQWSTWETIKLPTATTDGEKIRTCTLCGESELQAISKSDATPSPTKTPDSITDTQTPLPTNPPVATKPPTTTQRPATVITRLSQVKKLTAKKQKEENRYLILEKNIQCIRLRTSIRNKQEI